MRFILNLMVLLVFFSCKEEQNAKIIKNEIKKELGFTKLDASETGIKFKNEVIENLEFNFLNYAYISNGGGVSTGDINNDGLIDIYFTSNQNENKLYLNKGDFKFEDITTNANVIDDKGWSTGATMIDINNDGWLDIYVCKSASLKDNELRKNKLYINQKDNTFKEEAKKWGLDYQGFSIQSYFFDMDKDGDLDMYLVNHRTDFKNNTKISTIIQNDIKYEFSDQLFRNDGNKFINISKQANILNKAWGLSAVIGDFNNDSWPDIYVCNDYLEPDMLYINNKNNTFKNKILTQVRHTSFYSMGSDFADINNDLLPDLSVVDMTPSDHIRSKTNMASMSTANFNSMVNIGYHHQYMFNMLQLNNGNETFSDIGQISGISKTDWSWAPLIADFDNDGLKDIFITNGIVKDMSNNDFKNNLRQKSTQGESMTIESVLFMIPEKRIKNYMFINKGDLKFKNKAQDWNLDTPSYSNGSAYADFDNDGDLDLVINNMKDEAFVYKNNSKNNYLQIELIGNAKNKLAIGSKVFVYAEEIQQMQELYLSRGYQSSVTNKLNFGLNKIKKIDSIKIIWPDNKVTNLNDVRVNQLLSIDYKTANSKIYNNKKSMFITKVNPTSLGLNFVHKENVFDAYRKQILLPHSQSQNGPFITKADVNNDGLEDFYIGGASGQSGELYIQNENGQFTTSSSNFFEKDKQYEDLGTVFFDADNDKDLDLYVVSGGAKFSHKDKMYQDRLYINDGNGNFIKSINKLPTITSSGQSVIATDVDNDGDIDLFVGGRIIPDKYPYAPKSLLLINEDGIFKDKIKKLAPELESNSMISNAIFTDYDNDGDKDILAVGEWSKIQFYKNNNGKFSKTKISNLDKTRGLWFGLNEIDLDKDGNMDYFIGNLGLNAKFKTYNSNEFHVFCDDFDNNGTFDVVLSNKYNGNLVPSRGKECSTQQMPFVSQKFPTYQQFAEANLEDVIGKDKLKNALHYQADIMYSVFLKNKGNGNFEIIKLPNHAQLSPIQSFNFKDLDKDGTKEIICVGNLFSAEVETQRYDASYGAVLKFDKGNFKALPYTKTGLSTTGDAKNSTIITIKNKDYLIVTNNNGALDLFKIN